ncbi:MAG: suppressor of fused domain protein [Nibricoccus sp.]
MSAANNTEHGWFERVWAYREEEVYPSLFGRESKGIYSLNAEILADTFKQESIDPRWLHYGVFQFAPTAARRSWLYVTSGMSNDWDSDLPDPKGFSGLGCEFILETVAESQWAILRLLHVMAFQILLAHGRYAGRETLSVYDRIPLKAPLVGDSKLTFLILAPAVGTPDSVQLESGRFEFFHLAAVTDLEAAFAREIGGPALLQTHAQSGLFPIIDPDRSELIPKRA